MAELWPAGLPNRFLVDSYQEGLADNRLRSQMERGPAKVRRVSTRAPRKINGGMAMDSAQLAELRTFVEFTTYGAALAFFFPDQITGELKLVRFGETLPQWTYMGLDLWHVEFEIEVLN